MSHSPSISSVLNAGPMESWKQFRLKIDGLPPLPKRFLHDELGSSSMEVSLNVMPPGKGMPFTHRHNANEEVYVFLNGIGEFLVDDEVIPIEPGTCIRCAPEAHRCWRNTGDEMMPFLCIQARAGSFVGDANVSDGEITSGPPDWTAIVGSGKS